MTGRADYHILLYRGSASARVTIELRGIPLDLSEAEAERLAVFIRSLVPRGERKP